MEQPALGNVGDDALGCNLTWSWEGGWRLRAWARASGSSEWRQATLYGRHEPRLEAVVDLLGELVGLYGIPYELDGWSDGEN